MWWGGVTSLKCNICTVGDKVKEAEMKEGSGPKQKNTWHLKVKVKLLERGAVGGVKKKVKLQKDRKTKLSDSQHMAAGEVDRQVTQA